MVPSHGAPVDRGGPSHDEHGTPTSTPRGVPGLEGLSSKPPAKMIRGKGGADGRVYHSTSLFVLRPYHFPRRLAILILEANFFEPFIAVTILLNVITMASASPLDPHNTPKAALIKVSSLQFPLNLLEQYDCEQCLWLLDAASLPPHLSALRTIPHAASPLLLVLHAQSLESVFLFIFTSELVLKVTAYGFAMHRHSYMRDPWCILDFFVVTLAWVPVFVPSFAQYSFIRALRALRPLRTLRFLPGMPVLIGSIFKSIPALGNVAGLCSFIFLIFGIVGEELFEGALHYQCYYEGESNAPTLRHLESAAAGASWPRAGSRSGRLLKGGGGGESAVEFCAPSDPNACLDDEAGKFGTCLYYADNPPAANVDYDSVINACFGIMQIITFDTWTPAMYNLMQSVSPNVWVYYLLVALLGGFFVVNLFLAVVFDEFMRSKEIAEVTSSLEDTANRMEVKARAELGERETAPMLGAVGRSHTMQVFAGKLPPGKHAGMRFLRPVVDSKLFSYLTVVVLLCNLVIMCMPYAGQSEAYGEMLETLSNVFTTAFMVELLIKVLGLGCREFVSNPWNLFDTTLVLVAMADSLVTMLGVSGHFNVTYLRMLRMMRVLRMMRMMQYWNGLLRIFTCLMGAGQQMVNIFVLLFVFMTMFSLLGMQLFGGGCGSDESRFHFDYYMPAMLTVLSIFSGGWVDPFNACTETSIPLARIFTLAALVIGFFVIFNLFIAILLDSFASEEEDEEEGEEGEHAEEELKPGETGGKLGRLSGDESPELPSASESTSEMLFLKRVCLQLVRHPWWESFIILAILVSSVTLVIDHPRLDPASTTKFVLTQCNYFFTALFTVELLTKVFAYDLLVVPDGYLLSAWNLLDLFIVTVSLVSLSPEMTKLAALRLLRVLRPLRLLSRIPGMKVIFSFFAIAAWDVVNVTGVILFFQTVFAVLGMELFSGSFASCTVPEIAIKELCVPGPASLLGSALGAVDGHRSLLQTASYINESRHDAFVLSNAQSLQATTAERNWFDKLPVVPSWVFPSGAPQNPPLLPPSSPPTDQMEAVAALDSSGMDEAGAEHRRVSNIRRSSSDVVHPNAHQMRYGRRLKGGGGSGDNIDLPVGWLNPSFGSFDDFGSAMMILFIAATGDGWEDFMFAGMDAVGKGKSPERNDFSPAALFFVAWLLLGTFTMMNLFIGSVVDNFTRIKADLEGSATMTKAQKQWVRTMQEAAGKKAPAKLPKPPRMPYLRPFFNLVTSKHFDIFITVVIISNILVMAIDFHHIEEYPGYYNFYTGALAFFGNVYYAECVLKILGLGFASYFRDSWNRFDFFLVTTSLLDQFAADMMAKVMPIPPMLMRMLRVLRIMRIMRLLKGFKGLRDLLMTMVLSFPSFLNVGALLGLVTFIYAVLGVQLFTFVMKGEELNDQRNFFDFSSAYLLLVQCLTGDNWSGLMYDAMVGPERGCDLTLVPTNCGNSIAIPYFISYTVVGAFVLLNLVVAVILENFTAMGDINPDLVSANDIAEFGEIWATVDDDATGMITPEALAEVLLILPPPLGLAGTTDAAGALKIIHDLDVDPDRINGGYLLFAPVTEALIHRSYDAQEVERVPELARHSSLSNVSGRGSADIHPRPSSQTGHQVGCHEDTEARAAAPVLHVSAAKAMCHEGSGDGRPFGGIGRGSGSALNPVPALKLAKRSANSPASPQQTWKGQAGSPIQNTTTDSATKRSASYAPVQQYLPRVPMTHHGDCNVHGVEGSRAGDPPRLGGEPPPFTSVPHVAKANMPPVRRPLPKLAQGGGEQTLPTPVRLPAPTPGRTIQAPPRPPPGQPPRLPEGWKCVTTRAGAYYYNEITRQVSWQPPIEWLRSPNRRPDTSGPPRGPTWEA